VIELAAGVQDRHHDLRRAHAAVRHDADRNASTVVLDRDRAVEVHRHVDVLGVPGEVLVDAVVHDLPHEVVEGGAVVDVTDVHAGPQAHGLEPLENGDVFRVVVARGSGRFGG
jgi:hypothetical protein